MYTNQKYLALALSFLLGMQHMAFCADLPFNNQPQGQIALPSVESKGVEKLADTIEDILAQETTKEVETNLFPKIREGGNIALTESQTTYLDEGGILKSSTKDGKQVWVLGQDAWRSVLVRTMAVSAGTTAALFSAILWYVWQRGKSFENRLNRQIEFSRS